MNTQTKPDAKVNNSELTTSSRTTFGLVEKISEKKIAQISIQMIPSKSVHKTPTKQHKLGKVFAILHFKQGWTCKK